MEEPGEGSKQTNDELVEEMKTSESRSPVEEAAMAPASLDTQEDGTAISKESEGATGKATEEPSVDWFEPLEEDNDEHDDLSCDASTNGRREAEEESLASERSGGAPYSEKNTKKPGFMHQRRKRMPEEGWDDWSVLGEGWKRKVVVRRSGTSVGQHDVYYMSPQNVRVRSRVELAKVLDIDLSTFEYKLGMFGNISQPLRARRKKRDRSPCSESSWADKGECDSPDYHPRTKSVPRVGHHNYHKSLSPQGHSPTGTRSIDPQSSLAPISPALEEGTMDRPAKLPWRPATSPTSSVNGKALQEAHFGVCAKCGNSYTILASEKPRKKLCCPKCRAKKPVDNRQIVFRKWIPCGRCLACLTTADCGMCASCKKGMLNTDFRKPVRCRKRKCICPIRKNKQDGPRWVDPIMDNQQEVVEPQSSVHHSDTEDYSVYVDVDGEDEEFDGDDADYEAWEKKRKRRACGKCEACLSRKDCGSCDFCIDKPKFGGSNKKRQKCRLRQCQRQAMLGLGEFETQDGMRRLGRPRPYHTYGRNTGQRKRKQFDWELTDEEEKGHGSEPAIKSKPVYRKSFQPTLQMGQGGVDVVKRNGFFASGPNPAVPGTPLSMRMGATQRKDKGVDMLSRNPEEDEEVTPMITQIFSLAESPAGNHASDMDQELLKLLESTRTAALPILWYAIMMEGPQLLLVQCSKTSTMTDTVVQIDPGFCYQVAVQGQPLLLTHPLYEDHPAHLASVTAVVNLLLDLEGRYRVCQGVPNTEPPPSSGKQPFICERASTCDFLVLKDDDCCTKCRAFSL